MNKFKNKFRTQTIRLQTWDYSKNGKYHITICTHKMKHYFGQIKNDVMTFSAEGKIALNNLTNLPIQFPNLKLDEFQIMPNHIHAIIVIVKKSPIKFSLLQVDDSCEEISPDRNIVNSIPTIKQLNDLSNFEKAYEFAGGVTGSKNPMLHEGISSAIRFFKGKTTYEIHKINKSFKWHPRFYDVIIRNMKQLESTRKYIRDNPKNWEKKI